MEHAFSRQCSGTLRENVGQQNPGTNVPKQSSAYKGFAIGYGVFCGGFFIILCVAGVILRLFCISFGFWCPLGHKKRTQTENDVKKAPPSSQSTSLWEVFFRLGGILFVVFFECFFCWLFAAFYLFGLSLLHISQPPRRYAIPFAAFCCTKKKYLSHSQMIILLI